MTTPDVNVLVAAFRASHVHHRQARAWLTSALESCATGGNVELLPMVAAGFLRVATNRKVLGIAESRPRYGVRKKARRRRKVARAA